MKRLAIVLLTLILLPGCAPQPATAPSTATPSSVHKTPANETEAIQALFQSALHQMRQNNMEAGLQDLRKAADLQPDNPEIVEAYLVVALKLRKLGRHEDGLKVVDLALERAPEKAHFWQAKGSFLFAAEKPEEARTALLKARELAPKDPNIPYDMGWQGSQNPETYEQALEDYSDAISVDDTYQRAWANRGALKNKMGRHQEALKDLDRSLELQPEDSVALYEKASALVALKKPDEAAQAAQKVIDLNNNPQAVALAKMLVKPADKPSPASK
ncbi:MAG: tetratricopeptide repeat protein [Candidatus Eremiobacteraeota bacterium]|nr:tetratricopeptide repeat protein [Candidatus Eremiobacteraeota bacterium]